MIRTLPLYLLLVAGPVWAQTGADVSGTIHQARCETVEVAGATGDVDENGSFRLRVPLAAAAYVTVECGWRLPMFLTPGDDLQVTVSAEGEVAFAGRGAKSNAYLTRTDGLVARPFMRTLFPLRTASYPMFSAAWDSLRFVDEAALSALLESGEIDSLFADVERARIDAVWAHGHLAYPVLNWRDGDAASIRTTPGTDEALDAIDLGDARYLVLPEFVEAARALVHEKAREMLRTDSVYQAGDNQWLRAKVDWVIEHVDHPEVRDVLLHATLMTHLDQNGSENVEPILARFADAMENTALFREVVRAYANERRYWAGDRAETYKRVEGTTLEAHIERPEGADPDDRLPVFVWLHGGSFDTGAWYHCPFLCRTARSEGMAVIRLEQRSADRFQTTPADQLDDVRDALVWMRENADRLRIDPERVVLGGFSSGATLAVMAAAVDEGRVPPEAIPDAAVAVAACVNPLDGDGWFRKSIAAAGDDPVRYAPSEQVRAGAAPLLLVHGTEDEFCEWEPVQPYAEAMTAVGNDVEVAALDGQPHFFLFRSPESRTQALESVSAFLRSRGLVSDTGAGVNADTP
ncbi:MAG: hypothetical protein Rubg2KO_30220 [Rubricoccaceae bacterium]